MMEGINNIKRKKTGENSSKGRASSRDSEISIKDGNKNQKNDIYCKKDARDREVSNSSSGSQHNDQKRNPQEKKNSQLSPRNLVTVGDGEKQKKMMMPQSLQQTSLRAVAST